MIRILWDAEKLGSCIQGCEKVEVVEPKSRYNALVGAKIGGVVAMNGSKFTSKVDMSGMQVEGDLFMHGGAEFREPLTLAFAKIGKNLNLSGSELPSIDLYGGHVRGEFALASGRDSEPKWHGDAELILCNTEVGALQDLASSEEFPDAWPHTLKLDGFIYSRLGGLALGEGGDMAAKKLSWFTQWLNRQKHYSPQPYEQLVSVLRKSGYNDKATAILYESKRRERRETTKVLSPTWWWLTFQRLFIGYGYRNFRVLFWFFGFWMLGLVMLRITKQNIVHRMKYWGLAYSLDLLLPIIELHKPHYDKILLDGWVRVFFYVHKIFGYVLASFLIAGLSGLTKR